MALPPIIANLPFFRFFQNSRPDTPPAANGAGSAQTSPNNAPDDIVDVYKTPSGGSKENLTGGEAVSLAARTQELLSSSELSLGLDPRFG